MSRTWVHQVFHHSRRYQNLFFICWTNGITEVDDQETNNTNISHFVFIVKIQGCFNSNARTKAGKGILNVNPSICLYNTSLVQRAIDTRQVTIEFVVFYLCVCVCVCVCVCLCMCFRKLINFFVLGLVFFFFFFVYT